MKPDKPAWAPARSLRALPPGTVLRWRGAPPADSPSPRAIRSSLHTRVLGRTAVCLRRASSTNAVALAFAEGGCPDGCVVTAEEQTRGRGRLGRSWHSPASGGLWFSVVLRPSVPLSRAQILTMLGSVAVARALRDLHGITVELRWPNDVMAGARKVAGVLTELAGEQGIIRHAVVGVGLNVNLRGREMPGRLREEAVSVADLAGGPVERIPLLRAILEGMDARYAVLSKDTGAALLREWRSLTHMVGTIVQLQQSGRTVEGTVAGVGPDGSLLLRMASGVVQSFSSGDVTVLR